MIPEEKAKELWNKFFHKEIDITGNGNGELAYQCALIAVNEIIVAIYAYDGSEPEVDFWEQVKTEIEKL